MIGLPGTSVFPRMVVSTWRNPLVDDSFDGFLRDSDLVIRCSLACPIMMQRCRRDAQIKLIRKNSCVMDPAHAHLPDTNLISLANNGQSMINGRAAGQCAMLRLACNQHSVISFSTG